MGFVEGPVPEEPTDEPTGIKVGRLNDDCYEARDRGAIADEQWIRERQGYLSPPPEVAQYINERVQSEHLQEVARETLKAIGFEIIEDDVAVKSLFEELGGQLGPFS